MTQNQPAPHTYVPGHVVVLDGAAAGTIVAGCAHVTGLGTVCGQRDDAPTHGGQSG